MTHDEQTEQRERSTTAGRRVRLPHIAAFAAVLLVGVAGGVLLGRGDAVPPQDPAGAPRAQSEPQLSAGDPIQGEPARGAVSIVSNFLEAEMRGDHEASWRLLAEEDRERLGPLAQWKRSHADVPAVRAYRITGVQRRGGAVEVLTSLALQPALDEFRGLVPGKAVAAWPVVDSGGGQWRVLFSASVLLPRYPDEREARGAAEGWVSARQRCEVAESPYEGPLLGVAALARGLCDAHGRPDVGQPGALTEGPEAAPFVAAFGPDVHEWARVVPVHTPVLLRLVLAPVGNQWAVIGVLRAE